MFTQRCFLQKMRAVITLLLLAGVLRVAESKGKQQILSSFTLLFAQFWLVNLPANNCYK